MPGSTVSSATGSAASSASRRAKTRQYHTVARTSNVDESLFGTPNRVQQREGMLADKWGNGAGDEMVIERQAQERSMRRRSSKNKKETVQVITKDLIRNLIVPKEDPSGQSLVISRGELERIRRASQVITKDQRLAYEEYKKQEKERLQDESTERKNFMKTMDISRQKNQKLNDLEEQEKIKAEYLLQHAHEQRQEQEDEIKHLNELMLNAKCHAIRDAQVMEKGQIKGEMEEEELRLDEMMEVDRVNATKIQEEIDKTRKMERLSGAAKLLEQIQDNEQERLFELERKDQENALMQRYLERLNQEELERLEKKKEEASQLREDLNKANEDILVRKETAKDWEVQQELMLAEYQRAKAEREAAFEAEKERMRIEKERETARLRAQQERARDEQAERDAQRAKRIQEQAEREWRKKEAEEARKKAETEDMLKQSRALQMDQKEHFLAVQAQRERADFERVLRAQKELIEKEKAEEREILEKRHVHSDDVRSQIREKEGLRIADRNKWFEEGVKLDEEAKLRRQKLDAVKKKKLEDLRTAGVPEKYVAQVARKAQLPPDVFAT